jgi:hypothetical protein
MNSIVILKDDNGNEIKRDTGRIDDCQDYLRDGEKIAKLENLSETVEVLDNQLSSLEVQAKRDRHAFPVFHVYLLCDCFVLFLYGGR